MNVIQKKAASSSGTNEWINKKKNNQQHDKQNYFGLILLYGERISFHFIAITILMLSLSSNLSLVVFKNARSASATDELDNLSPRFVKWIFVRGERESEDGEGGGGSKKFTDTQNTVIRE